MNQSEPWSMAMLAEIYMLRLEAAARAAKETARFIPIALPVVKAPLPSIRESSSAKPVHRGIIELARQLVPRPPGERLDGVPLALIGALSASTLAPR
jgi:hypothetical protein